MRRELMIFGYFGRGNLGDETNLRRLVVLLQAVLPGRKITVITAHPARIATELKVAAVAKFNFLKICAAMWRSRFFIGGCGNVFQDRTSLRSLIYYSFLVFMARLQGCRVVLYGQGIGPIRTRPGKWIAARAFSLVEMMILRDRVSIGALYGLGAVRSEIHFTAEPLLALDELSLEKVAAVWAEIGASPQRKIGLVVQENEFTTRLFWKQLIGTLHSGRNLALYLIAIDESHWTAWRELAEETGCVWLRENRDWERLQAVVGGLDLVVSVKLHGIVAAVNQGIPCFSLAVDPKIEGFCRQLEIPFYLFSGPTEAFDLGRRILAYLEGLAVGPRPTPENRRFWKALALENERILLKYLQAAEP